MSEMYCPYGGKLRFETPAKALKAAERLMSRRPQWPPAAWRGKALPVPALQGLAHLERNQSGQAEESMKVDVDWGPDWPEETWIKQQLAEMQRAYQQEAKPLVDRLVEIRALKMPRMIVWEDAQP